MGTNTRDGPDNLGSEAYFDPHNLLKIEAFSLGGLTGLKDGK